MVEKYSTLVKSWHPSWKEKPRLTNLSEMSKHPVWGDWVDVVHQDFQKILGKV